MSDCPFCEYKTPEPDDGDAYVRRWQEVAHMQTEHPQVIAERLRSAGMLEADAGFGGKPDDPSSLYVAVLELRAALRATVGQGTASPAERRLLDGIEHAVAEYEAGQDTEQRDG